MNARASRLDFTVLRWLGIYCWEDRESPPSCSSMASTCKSRRLCRVSFLFLLRYFWDGKQSFTVPTAST